MWRTGVFAGREEDWGDCWQGRGQGSLLAGQRTEVTAGRTEDRSTADRAVGRTFPIPALHTVWTQAAELLLHTLHITEITFPYTQPQSAQCVPCCCSCARETREFHRSELQHGSQLHTMQIVAMCKGMRSQLYVVCVTGVTKLPYL